MERTQIATAALARNARYLEEVVEALGLCPFARRCREDGKLVRRVLFPEDDALRAVSDVDASAEVALFIFPLAPQGSLAAARAFEAYAASLREQLPKPLQFYCVPFHPDLPRDVLDAHRAVAFLRRAPDPTLQLVRASVLQAVRGEPKLRYVDTARKDLAKLLELPRPETLSDRIARDNLRTLEREGADRVEALLTSLRR